MKRTVFVVSEIYHCSRCPNTKCIGTGIISRPDEGSLWYDKLLCKKANKKVGTLKWIPKWCPIQGSTSQQILKGTKPPNDKGKEK